MIFDKDEESGKDKDDEWDNSNKQNLLTVYGKYNYNHDGQHWVNFSPGLLQPNPTRYQYHNITLPALRRIGFAATVPLVPAPAPAPEAAHQRSDGPILRSTFHVETGSRCVSGCRFFNQFG